MTRKPVGPSHGTSLDWLLRLTVNPRCYGMFAIESDCKGGLKRRICRI